MISAESGVKLDNIQREKITEGHLATLQKKCEIDAWLNNIFFGDTPALTEHRAEARRLVHNHGVGLIIIDYLQLMSDPEVAGKVREQEIGKISRELKALAKELHILIIALSQLSRDIEKQQGGAVN